MFSNWMPNYKQSIKNLFLWKKLTNTCLVCFRKSSPAIWRSQPTGRRLRQRPTPPERCTSPHSRTLPSRHKTLRHLQAAPGIPRLRLQDPSPLPRDGIHPPRRHRRIQTPRHHSQGGGVHQRVETEGPGHLRVGNPRQTAIRRCLWQVQRAVRQFDQQDPPEQNRNASALPTPHPLPVQRDLPQLPLPAAEDVALLAPAEARAALLAEFAFGYGHSGGGARRCF